MTLKLSYDTTYHAPYLYHRTMFSVVGNRTVYEKFFKLPRRNDSVRIFRRAFFNSHNGAQKRKLNGQSRLGVILGIETALPGLYVNTTSSSDKTGYRQ